MWGLKSKRSQNVLGVSQLFNLNTILEKEVFLLNLFCTKNWVGFEIKTLIQNIFWLVIRQHDHLHWLFSLFWGVKNFTYPNNQKISIFEQISKYQKYIIYMFQPETVTSRNFIIRITWVPYSILQVFLSWALTHREHEMNVTTRLKMPNLPATSR